MAVSRYIPDDSKPPSKAERLGVYMVLQFLPDGHWRLRPAEFDAYVVDIAPEHRALVRNWILFYLAWLFRLCVAGKYGNTVARDMMDAVYYRLARIEDAKSLGTNIKSWFDQLNTVGAHVQQGLKIGGIEVPATAYAAIRFMSADPESPCYGGNATDAPFSDQVIFAISKVHADMMVPIGKTVDAFN